MQIKTLILSILTATVAFAGCSNLNTQRIALPECEIAYNAYNEPFEQIISNGRPKVVISKIISPKIGKNVLFTNVELLKQQIERYSDFDFIFYFATTSENLPAVRSVAESTGLKIIAIVDAQDSFRKSNKMDERTIFSAIVVDNELRRYPSAIPGFELSPFDETMQDYIRHHKSK